MKRRKFQHLLTAFVIALCLSGREAVSPAGEAATRPASWTFILGPGPIEAGAVAVPPDAAYTPQRGYGFDGGAAVKAVDRGGAEGRTRGFCTSDKPFFFSVDVPEGNYTVTVALGDPDGESDTTVKAEARRLVLERVRTPTGNVQQRSFTVNVRNSRLKSGEHVKLKPDEQGHLDWDGKLTLEFSGARPCVSRLDVTRADDAVTLFIAGDSTVCDQGKEPYCGWGQMLPRFFKAGAAVANEAESGESARSFVGAKRLAKIWETIKPGDYLLIQFGHNDQKDKQPGAGAFTSYQQLLREYVAGARERGATPVLVTSMNRRTFDSAGNITPSLGDFPEAMRRLAKEQNVPLIDLNAMSKTLYEAWGPEGSLKAFVHYPAGTFPGQVKELKDNTHFNAYGAYELARCVIEGMKANHLAVTRLLADDLPAFDPARPDSVRAWALPSSPTTTTAAPEGH